MMLGKRFEELGTVGAAEWGSLFGPLDERGEPIPYDDLPLVTAVRNGRPAHAEYVIHSSDGASHEVEVSAFRSSPRTARRAGSRSSGRPRQTGNPGAAGMKVELWGTRGSIPAPGPETIRYGGNTSCVGVTLSDGTLLALDAGSGIRSLGLALSDEPRRLHILLTHLHLDHSSASPSSPRLPPPDRDRDLGPGLARGLAARPHRPLHLRPALAGRGAGAALRRLLPQRPRQRVGDRLGADPRRLGLPPRADARLPDRRRRLLAHLHPRPRAGARRRPRPARGRLDLRLRPRPRHLAADPRRPVHAVPSTPTTLAGATRRCATRSPSPTAPAPSAPSSSTTTRRTPTTSSIASAPRRRSARPRWAGTRCGDRAGRRAGRVRASRAARGPSPRPDRP